MSVMVTLESSCISSASVLLPNMVTKHQAKNISSGVPKEDVEENTGYLIERQNSTYIIRQCGREKASHQDKLAMRRTCGEDTSNKMSACIHHNEPLHREVRLGQTKTQMGGHFRKGGSEAVVKDNEG